MNGFLDRLKELLGVGHPPPAPGGQPAPVPELLETAADAAGAAVDVPSRAAIIADLQVIAAARVRMQLGGSDRFKLSEQPQWKALMTASPEAQLAAAIVIGTTKAKTIQDVRFDYDWHQLSGQMLGLLLRKPLPITADQLCVLVEHVPGGRSYWGHARINAILGAAERFCDGKPPPGMLGIVLTHYLRRLRANAGPHPVQAERKLMLQVEAILDPADRTDVMRLPPGAWGKEAAAWVEQQGEAAEAWQALIAHALEAGDKAKPGKTWLEDADALVGAVGKDTVAAQLAGWMEGVTPDPEQPDPSLDALKGLIWCAALLDPKTIATPVGRFAEVCFRKVPNIGARSVKLGNACMVTLSSMAPAEEAIAELVRLKARIKYGSAKGLIDRQLAGIAEDQGVAAADLEEGALPTWDIGPDGRFEQKLGETTAVIALTDGGAELQWVDGKGKTRAAAPAAVKADHAGDIRALKKRLKDINDATVGQVTLLENSWLGGRSWSMPLWRTRFLDHPIRSPIVRALIWRLEEDQEVVSAMPGPEGWVDASGARVSPPDNATIRLWHPLDSSPEDVLTWRRRIMDLGITQPIKQAHREIYVLTDAELRTETYSNRFAAHIIRQHQFRALCQARGWSYQLQGSWDSFNAPVRNVPSRGITVEYHVDIAGNDESSQSGVALHLATDQVRFHDAEGRQMQLIDIPPIVFSELMRDVDLFVAVCSVANDPDWVDGGPDGRHGVYWTHHAFGDLSVTARTRRDLLEQLAPRLAIADRLKVEGNFLEVRGQRQSYRIHIGSGNIQILPSNRYLCIVRGATKEHDSGPVRLPFAGDSTLAIILSKAFMLASDNQITDPTILRQL